MSSLFFEYKNSIVNCLSIVNSTCSRSIHLRDPERGVQEQPRQLQAHLLPVRQRARRVQHLLSHHPPRGARRGCRARQTRLKVRGKCFVEGRERSYLNISEQEGYKGLRHDLAGLFQGSRGLLLSLCCNHLNDRY